MATEKSLSAEEARDMANRALSLAEADPWLEHVYRGIRLAASEGRMKTTHPFFNVLLRPSSVVQEHIWKVLREDGYEVLNHFIEIKWG